jgi:hypothetical protein
VQFDKKNGPYMAVIQSAELESEGQIFHYASGSETQLAAPVFQYLLGYSVKNQLSYNFKGLPYVCRGMNESLLFDRFLLLEMKWILELVMKPSVPEYKFVFGLVEKEISI